MDVRIQSIHFDATEKLEAFIEKKVNKLEQYYDEILSGEVVLKVTRPESVKNKEASIKLLANNGDFFAQKISDTFEGAVDEAVKALEKQIVKHKEKQRAK